MMTTTTTTTMMIHSMTTKHTHTKFGNSSGFDKWKTLKINEGHNPYLIKFIRTDFFYPKTVLNHFPFSGH
jgi:hypothetical protein